MPTYHYRCLECAKGQDAVRRIAERDDCPKCDRCYGITERRITATMVSVFNPYTTVAFDKETGTRMQIKSASEHRAFLARNGYEEVGNDKSCAPRAPEEIQHRRAEMLKEQGSPEFQFDESTHEANL